MRTTEQHRATRRRRASLTTLVVLALAAVLGWAPTPAAGQSPTSAEVGDTDWRQVSAGNQHTCAVKTDGRLYCWGAGGVNGSQLGLGSATPTGDQSTPAQVDGSSTDWKQVSVGADHTCAVRTTGRLYCWGSDSRGQLGNGDLLGDGLGDGGSNIPLEVTGGFTDWVQVSAALGFTCGRRTGGRLFCWGADDGGQVGNGDPLADEWAPEPVGGASAIWRTVTAGGDRHACGRKDSGRIMCWGSSALGNLGGSRSDIRSHPVLVGNRTAIWTNDLAAGGGHACARKRTGQLFCWGRDESGQLGNGTGTSSQQTPARVAGTSTSWTRVSAEPNNSCALKSTGRVFCWGRDDNGQLGNGTPNLLSESPALVAGGANDWVAVDVGGFHSCALRASGRLFCWGANYEGELGDGGPIGEQPQPVEVAAAA